MSRRRRNMRDDDPWGKLNLAPLMNMVMILIPLLLLSTVFLKVGVVNVSSPKIAPDEAEAASDREDEEKWSLDVAIGAEGFEVVSGGEVVPPVEGCPADGPTICLTEPDVDVKDRIERSNRAIADGRTERGAELLRELSAVYDYAELYNQLSRLKEEHPNHTKVRMTASPKIPYRLVIRTMDAMRYRLESKKVASNSEFWNANRTARGDDGGALFSDPVLAIGR